MVIAGPQCSYTQRTPVSFADKAGVGIDLQITSQDIILDRPRSDINA